MEVFFEQFLNGIYQTALQELTSQFGPPPYHCPIIKFGGFRFSHNWYGKTSMNYDEVGNLRIFTKTIYLNSLFLTQQFGITNNSEYNLSRLANTMAHELAHCLRADYEPKEAGKHDLEHFFLTFGIEYYILNTYEFRLLEQLAQWQKKRTK